MYVRAYLRASTQEQDATRAKEALTAFAEQHGQKVAAYYVENQSGASLQRPELFRLLDDAHPGDVLLIEQVDRLSRLTEDDWQQLRQTIRAKGVLVVALDLPTSHQSMQQTNADEFTGRMLAAINNMLLDMLAAIARKDYEDRRRRQAQGIEKAKAKGAFKGKQIDKQLHQRILTCLAKGMSIREAAAATGASTATVQRAKNRAAESEAG
ncbi:resolvase [Halopseudomonas aestusnigri]|uniref:recombinase family protein n=1 Tax=Halopseudomonas TaxID=2901189 RepID=UPI0022B712D8|nr:MULTISPECIES: recombinase family protein [Halopseudomonas]BDX17864.1 resolvase [Halopseudomonas aestusnigri]